MPVPFCPTCKYEYREGIERCPECDVDLVEKLDEEPKDTTDPELTDEELVPVFACADLTEIELVKGILESAGIPVYNRPRYVEWPSDFSISPFIDNNIYVPACHAEQAMELLKVVQQSGGLG